MLRKYLRKFHYKYRFVPWYRKAYYYKCKKDKMDEIIAKYKEPEELADPKYVKKLKRDMIRCLSWSTNATNGGWNAMLGL